MQTLFDHCIKDLIVISLLATNFSSLTTLGWLPVKGSVFGGVASISFQVWSASLMFGQLIVTMITRYMLIFHSVKMINVNDWSFVLLSRLTIFLLSFLTALGENLTSDFSRSISFVELTGIQPEEGIRNLSMYFVTTWIFAIIMVVGFVMIRIELLKMKVFTPKNNKSNTEGFVIISESMIHIHENAFNFRLDLGYSPNTIRVMAILMISMSVLLILYLTDLLIDDPYLNRILFHTFFHVILFSVLPIIIISRNENMRKYFLKTLRSLAPFLRGNSIHDLNSPA